MTVPREWPNSAREARDRSAEEQAQALRLLYVVARNGGKITTDDKARAISLAIYHLQNSLRWLESVGAPTRPYMVFDSDDGGDLPK